MITGVPTFYNGEIPSAAKFNQLGVAVTVKFAGAITPGDLTWPFIVEGNIDFDNLWGIVSLNKFWKIINADEYDDFADAITAAEGMSGGACVLIPPSTTIKTDTIDIDASNITIMGCGKSSVLQLNPGASGGYLLRTGAGSLSNISIENLTLAGIDVSSQVGVIVRRVTNFTMRDVLMKNFDDDCIRITHDGTEGNSCLDAKILDCKFLDGGASHVRVIDVDGLNIRDMKSEGCAAIAIEMETSSAAGLLKHIKLDNIDIETPTGVGVSILGASGTADNKWSLIELRGVTVSDAQSDGFNIGLTSKILKYVTMVGCSAPEAAADGAKVCVSASQISNNFFRDAGESGIDLIDTETSVISGNNVLEPDGVIGGHVALVNSSAASLGNRITGNHGYVGMTDGAVHSDSVGYALGAGVEGDSGFLYTIPANTVHPGSVIRIRVYWNMAAGGAGVNGEFQLRIDGTIIDTYVSLFAASITGGASNYDIHVNHMTDADNTKTGSMHTSRYSAGQVGTDGENVSDTIDWTVDNDVTFYFNVQGTTNTFQLYRISIEILGGAE